MNGDKLTINWTEAESDVDITVEDDVTFRVMAYTSTGQLSSGTRRESKTFRFRNGGMNYRIQIQRWEVNE
jgi:hypothetical protein